MQGPERWFSTAPSTPPSVGGAPVRVPAGRRSPPPAHRRGTAGMFSSCTIAATAVQRQETQFAALWPQSSSSHLPAPGLGVRDGPASKPSPSLWHQLFVFFGGVAEFLFVAPGDPGWAPGSRDGKNPPLPPAPNPCRLLLGWDAALRCPLKPAGPPSAPPSAPQHLIVQSQCPPVLPRDPQIPSSATQYHQDTLPVPSWCSPAPHSTIPVPPSASQSPPSIPQC